MLKDVKLTVIVITFVIGMVAGAVANKTVQRATVEETMNPAVLQQEIARLKAENEQLKAMRTTRTIYVRRNSDGREFAGTKPKVVSDPRRIVRLD